MKIDYGKQKAGGNGTKAILLILILSSFAVSHSYAQAAIAPRNTVIQNETIATLLYYCFPAPSAVYKNSSESVNASAATTCETGAFAGIEPAGANLRYTLVPAFAGFSIYGYTKYNATPDGYPTFNGMPIVTGCGAALTKKSCNGSVYLYSPFQSASERSIGIYNGINGLPEGVLPNSAFDDLVYPVETGTVSRTYRVNVKVYDPNIFPNITTGECSQIAPSNLTNATGNCLTSLNALQAAIDTNDSAVAEINANNPLWTTAGRPDTEAVILVINVTSGAIGYEPNVSMGNTNIQGYYYENEIGNSTTATTTVPPAIIISSTIASTPNQNNQGTRIPPLIYYAILAAVAIAAIWVLGNRRRAKSKA